MSILTVIITIHSKLLGLIQRFELSAHTFSAQGHYSYPTELKLENDIPLRQTQQELWQLYINILLHCSRF